eukprot:CAMPEP_0178434536 /NCGR_PEP_ID=MMETSP0689_2-20121128/33473_1 /TAXON_ID=160604 /ORGANISM="Amphidinium massartii, Strain CS-259" /LENGTH=167 /DNA_ID=CAMNT_0020056601 /DNA_START=114 /DNA_END=614 /DNA_ORIENTATION=+
MPSADTRVLQSIASWNGDAAVWQEWCFQIRAEFSDRTEKQSLGVLKDIKRQVKQWSLTRAELLLPLPQVGPQACGVLGKDCAMMRIAVLSFFFGAVSTLLIIGAVWRLRSRRIVKTKAVQTAVDVTEAEIQTSAVAPTVSSPADTASASAVPPGSSSCERGGAASNW